MAVIGYSSSVIYQYGGGSIMGKYNNIKNLAAIVCAEVSNLPMHVRMILKNINLRYTKAYEACEMAYMILYMSFRGLIAPLMVYGAWRETNCPMVVRLSAVGING